MSVLVRIPTPLRPLTRGQAEVTVEAHTIAALIEGLEAEYAGLRERLCEDGGAIRRFINIYVNEEDIRFLDGTATALRPGDQVSIVPAIAGGSGRAPAAAAR
jgi:molybdopterin synthase sulfur carrier subunit